jgi:glycerol-3-phosphate dehydrogenase (NAD(P)+)
VDSRNYTVGYRLAQGETLDQILSTMDEIAEGVNTVRIVDAFIKTAGIRAPITENLHRVLFEELPIADALQFLMKYPFSVDVDFV